jgi:pyruvate,orthophosphate dikinase
MEYTLPKAYGELKRIYNVLERHYRDMQDLEFTVEQGKLWMLQTRSGKRTAKAALRIAVELANEGLISRSDAVLRVDPLSLDQLLHPTIDPRAHRRVIATGLPASPGAATGEIVFSSDEAAQLKTDGKKVVLVRVETSPEDIHGMHAAEGILTTRGGMTPTPLWWRAAWASPAFRARVRFASTTPLAQCQRAARRSKKATTLPSTARPDRCWPARST